MEKVEVPKELADKVYRLIEAVKTDGKLRKGTNETTKSIERGEAKLVVAASDVNPPEIILHLPILCKEKQVPFIAVPSKDELGAAAGMPVGTAALAVAQIGESKKQFTTVIQDLEALKAPVEKKIEPKVEAKPTEKPKAEEKKIEAPKVEPKKAEAPKPLEKVEAKPVEKKEIPKVEVKKELPKPVEPKPAEKKPELKKVEAPKSEVKEQKPEKKEAPKPAK